MTLSAVVAARARASLFAVAKWSRVPALGRFVAGRFGETWVDPTEAEAFDLAARSAYRGGMSVDGAASPLSTAADIDGIGSDAPAVPAAGPRFVLTPPRQSAADDDATILTSAWLPTSGGGLVGPDETGELTDVETDTASRPGPPQKRKAGDTAPDFLLRTPTNVARVADDFFDGIVGVVEGRR